MPSHALATTIGAATRAARKARGLTQEDVAEQLGVSTEFYARVERGASLPSVPTLASMAATLGVSADRMLGAADPRSTATNATRDDVRPEVRRLVRRMAKASPRLLRAIAVILDEADRDRRAPARRR